MQMRFPRTDEAWMNHVEQVLMQLVVDRDRLMKVSPQTPDPEAGIAMTGPIVPDTFRFGDQGTEFLSGTQVESGTFAGTASAGTGLPLSGS